jgi:hypothetical protein
MKLQVGDIARMKRGKKRRIACKQDFFAKA